MELLTFSIAPGETKRFERAGRYLEIIEAPAALTIEMTGPNGEQADDMRGAVSGMFAEGQFNGFEVSNAAAYAQQVVIMLTDGRGGSRRQPGTVKVIDSGKDRTVAGQSFMEYNSQASSTAVRFASVQVWNPVGSGRRGIIQQLDVSSTQSTDVFFAIVAAPLTNIRRAILSKFSAGAAGICEMRRDDTATIPAPSAQFGRSVLANAPTLLQLRDPIVLMPGSGLVMWATPVPSVLTISANIEAVEEIL